MLVAPLSLRDVFEHNIHHIVPLFQRPYVWRREAQWAPLWEDLRRLAEHVLAGRPVRAHFLGATVHEKIPSPPGHIETRLVIDGQQRLTTLQILLEAFADKVAETGLDNYGQALLNLTRNNHPLSTSPQEKFKIWPTNADRDHFRQTMEAESPAALLKSYGVRADASRINHPIADAYLYFHSEISAWLGPDENGLENRVGALYAAIRDNVRLVVIDLDEHDDAQLIFETLNARGTPLLSADLVKNLLLQSAEASDADAEDLYNRYWRPFDDEANYWRADVGRGHAKRPRIEGFLQNFLTLKTVEQVPASHLYAVYRDFAHDAASGSPEEQLISLDHYAAIYRRLEGPGAPPRIALFLERITTMDVGTSYPFLLELFNVLETEPAFLEATLVDLESFLVRRMVCRLSTRGYNILFIGLVGALAADPADIPTNVRSALLSGTAEVDRWPDDEEFMQGWVGNPLYENLTRPRLRMLLEALERALRGSKLAETDDVPRNLTVEHIMPRAWETHWPLPPDEAPEVAAVARRRAIHTIGNLTLLSERLNPSISNGPWHDADHQTGKRSALIDHTVLHLNKQVCKRENWSEKAISERSNDLFELARTIWHRPNG